MALNTNIALGVQPIQQPNMLGQYAQVMAIKAAQQETEGYEGLRNALSKGVPNDPTSLLQYGKQGRATYESLLKGKKEQLDSAEKRLALTGQIAGYVRDNPTPENFASAVGTMVQNGVLTTEQAQRVIADAGNDPTKIKSYAERAAAEAVSEVDKMRDRTSRRNTDVSSAPSFMNAQLAREKFNLEQQRERSIQDILGGAPAGGPVNALAPQPEVSSAPANALAPQPSTPNMPAEVAQLDAQIGQLIRVGTPQALNAVNALVARRNILMPSQQVVQNEQGQYQLIDQRAGVSRPVMGADGQPLQGKVTPLPYESTYKQTVGRGLGESDLKLVQGAQNAVGKLQNINETLDQLKTSDAITGFGADVLKDVDRFRAQFMADKKAGKRASDTEILNAMLGSEVFGMIQSLGIGARGLDTPAEREYLREVMTGTVRMDKAALIKLTEIRKNVTERVIDEYNKKVDSGQLNKFFEMQGIAPTKIEKPAAPAASVTDSVESLKKAGLWQYMSPEEQKLWQK
jgi:hypothetical protein